MDAREAFKANKLGLEELRKVEDEAILEVLQMQKDVGIEIALSNNKGRGCHRNSVGGRG